MVAQSPGDAEGPPSSGSNGWKELEQLWRFQNRDKNAKGEAEARSCSECRATGTVECKFCGATGVLTLGDKLVCSVEGGKACPVCKGEGETRCSKCAGSGRIANWIL